MILLHAQMQVLRDTTVKVERVKAVTLMQRRCKQPDTRLAVDWFRAILPAQGVE
jgi:hypothetical protein